MTFPDEAHGPDALDPQLFERRKVLGSLGLAGLGVLASSASAGAFTFKKSGDPIPKVSVPTSYSGGTTAARVASMPDLPDEWARSQGGISSEYLRYLSSLNLKHVSPTQVIETHAKAKGSTWNSIPPRQWWKRMGYTLKVVDRIATEMNVGAVEVVSAYRSPSYNAHCPGAKSGSWHQANVAADVKFPVRASKVTATARELRDLGLFKGGVGGYWNFTHVDCRGKNVNW